jgi:hypothetical protein
VTAPALVRDLDQLIASLTAELAAERAARPHGSLYAELLSGRLVVLRTERAAATARAEDPRR